MGRPCSSFMPWGGQAGAVRGLGLGGSGRGDSRITRGCDAKTMRINSPGMVLCSYLKRSYHASAEAMRHFRMCPERTYTCTCGTGAGRS
jgi:hypothetical protein